MNGKTGVKAPSRILLVEDEANLAGPLQFNLEQEGYVVKTTASGRIALEWEAREAFDLIILDLMIQEMDGFEVARRVRQRDERLPILMLTARSAARDRIQGFSVGADDYLVKPFHLRELLLRVKRMLQRGEWYADTDAARIIDVAGFKVDLQGLSGEGPRGSLQLTVLEANLIEVMTSRPNHIFSRAELLSQVWGYHSSIETRTVDNFILRLRKYFEEEPEHPRHFVSVRGKGYMYVPQ